MSASFMLSPRTRSRKSARGRNSAGSTSTCSSILPAARIGEPAAMRPSSGSTVVHRFSSGLQRRAAGRFFAHANAARNSRHQLDGAFAFERTQMLVDALAILQPQPFGNFPTRRRQSMGSCVKRRIKARTSSCFGLRSSHGTHDTRRMSGTSLEGLAAPDKPTAASNKPLIFSASLYPRSERRAGQGYGPYRLTSDHAAAHHPCAPRA